MKKLLLITAFCFAFSLNAQVRLVKDILVGSQGSFPASFFVFDNSLYFSGLSLSGATLNRYIYKSDGTNAGTGIVYQSPSINLRDFRSSISQASYFYEFNSELYFDAYKAQDISYGSAIFKLTNGNTLIASQVEDFGIYSARFIYAETLNNKIIYVRSSSQGEPFLIDLTNAANNGILKDIYTGSGNNSNPSEFTKFGNKIFFSANDGAVNGREVWETDGTAAGTQLFANINFGNANSDPDQFTVLGSNMIFAATNAVTGRELFITDGTTVGTVILKNINPSGGDATPNNVTKIGSNIYFSADNGTDGLELWKSDGTTSGTIQIKDINPTGASNPSNFTQFGSNIYFTATNGTSGVELYVTNGSPNTAVLVKDINLSGDSDPRDLVVYNGKLYFTAFDGTDRELWSANGNSNGTVKIDVYPGANSSNPTDLLVFNNELYFNADSSANGVEPHAYIDPALSITDNNLNNSITLFPNPAKSMFQIASKVDIEKVELYSLQGQLVKEFITQSQYDVSDVAKGIYLVKVNSEESSYTSEKLIIE